MLLKKLELQNIRTHDHTSVDFQEGVMLFEGDVGSGKSSLLYSIEFALFGLGDLNASFLLRNSSNSGFVKLNFEVNGKNYEVYRSLEKKKTVQQGECYVIADGQKTAYTPSEMKPIILQILGFKEPPNPRSQSVIYRYAVFTPQEEMKKILEEKPEERLQTLRKAFGIEEYRIARDNSSVVLKELREEVRFLEGQTSDLPKLVDEKSQLQSKTSLLEKESSIAKEKASKSESQLSEAKKLFSEIQAQVSTLRAIKAELPLLKKRLEEKQSGLKDSLEQKDFIEKENVDSQKEKSELKIADIDYSKAQEEYKKIRSQSSVLTNEIGGLQSKQRDYTQLKEKGLCPTCGQEISGDFDKHFSEVAVQIIEKQGVLDKLKSEEEDLTGILEQAVQQNMLVQRKSELEKRMQRNSSELAGLLQKISSIQTEIPLLEKSISEKQSSLSAAGDIEAKAVVLEKSVLDAEKESKVALSEKTRLETQLQDSLMRLKDLDKRIFEKQEEQKKLGVLRERKMWLEEHFIPSLLLIETQVLAGLNREFGFLFKKWFSLLVESQELTVSVGEQFEPLVEINGYEHSYQTLSGGEKSALALAYRLALNALVKSVSASMQDNLLILDEPTDGFSKEQLGRMRAVLNELNSKQVLLVSHERELEAFADKVFKIEKKDGLSRITS